MSMKICFTLDDVLRAKTVKAIELYNRVYGKNLCIEDVKSADLSKVLAFPNKRQYQQFLYESEAFHIFVEAGLCSEMLDNEFNLWQIDQIENNEEDNEIDIMFANAREFNATIGYTYFFLSKIASRVREVYLPMDSLTIWDKCDVLVTADEKLLKEKPEGKVSVKIEMPYNKDCEADYTYSSLSEFLKDKDVVNKIYNDRV